MNKYIAYVPGQMPVIVEADDAFEAGQALDEANKSGFCVKALSLLPVITYQPFKPHEIVKLTAFAKGVIAAMERPRDLGERQLDRWYGYDAEFDVHILAEENEPVYAEAFRRRDGKTDHDRKIKLEV